MRIVVLNGSPKGDQSVTMQSVRYLAKLHPQHDWRILNVAHRVAVLEREEAQWAAVIDEVRSADAVVWGFPVYYLLVASQYKRFIELCFERGAAEAFAGKHTVSLSTSIHFFDHLAHAYVRGVAEDLGLRYVGGFSADMDDLLKPAERERLQFFAADFLTAVAENRPALRATAPLPATTFTYQPGEPAAPVVAGGRRVIIVTDQRSGDDTLTAMVARLAARFGGAAEVISLHELDIRAGCQGCCKCAFDNECTFEGVDGYIDFYRQRLQPADIIVLAGSVVDRNLSSKWRQFFDRSFFLNHAPSLMGKQFGVVLAGPVRHLPALREGLEAWVHLQRSNLLDFVTDEAADCTALDRLLDSFAERLVQAAERGYLKPPTFLGVAAHKLFRDELWGRMRWIFQADHRAYRRLGLYDFPQRDWRTRLRNAVIIPLTRIPTIRAEFRQRTRDEMVKAHQQVVDQA